MEYSIILESADFSSFLIEKSSHVYNTRRMIQKDNDIFPLLKCARFTIRPPPPFTRISHLLLLLQFFPLFSTYNVFHWYPQFLKKFSQFSLEICPKACKIKTRGCCAAMVGDITFPNAGTVLCYFEALLIGIILPQLEGHFKH